MLYNYNEHVWVVTARGCRDVASPPAHPVLSTAWWRSLCSTQERLRLNWSTSSCSMCPHYGWHGAAQNRGSLNRSEAGVVERTSPDQFPPNSRHENSSRKSLVSNSNKFRKCINPQHAICFHDIAAFQHCARGTYAGAKLNRFASLQKVPFLVRVYIYLQRLQIYLHLSALCRNVWALPSTAHFAKHCIERRYTLDQDKSRCKSSVCQQHLYVYVDSDYTRVFISCVSNNYLYSDL